MVVLAPQLRPGDAESMRRLERLAEHAAGLLSRAGKLILCWRAHEGSAGALLPRPAGLDCTDVTAEVAQRDFERSRVTLHCLECGRGSHRR